MEFDADVSEMKPVVGMCKMDNHDESMPDMSNKTVQESGTDSRPWMFRSRRSDVSLHRL